MKISVRTLKQEKYEFIVDESETIDTLKSMIQEKLGHEKSWQNLIFSGTMLDSSRTIASYKITEKDFLVLLVKKPKEETKPAAPAPVAVPTPVAAQPAQAPPAPAAAQPAVAAPAAQPAQPAAAGGDAEATIRRIMELGFERTMVERALQVAFGNADAAVELLMGGGYADEGEGEVEIDMEEEEEGTEAQQLFDILRSNPQFNNLRILARTNPQMLEQVLSQLPPEVLTVISNNQEEFIRLLSEDPTPPAGGAPAGGAPGGAPAGPGGAPGGFGGFGAPRTVTLTTDEQAIITNLVDLGFDRNRVLEAYLLFERDADMTANYLLNHGWDDAGAGGAGGFPGGGQ